MRRNKIEESLALIAGATIGAGLMFLFDPEKGGSRRRNLSQTAQGAIAGAGQAVGIWLHVNAANEAAIRVYEKSGYRLSGREEDYYGRGKPALVYAKLFDEA